MKKNLKLKQGKLIDQLLSPTKLCKKICGHQPTSKRSKTMQEHYQNGNKNILFNVSQPKTVTEPAIVECAV